MPDLNKIFLFRMLHIENISHILQYGITHVSSKNTNKDYIPIGDESLINTRGEFLLNNGNKLGDYIPFYFGVLTPMLYVIQKGYNNVKTTSAENIVYLVCSIQKIIDNNLEFIFTDGHAIDAMSTQYSLAEISEIESLLDFKTIKDRNFKDPNDLDKMRRKQAEFLVASDVPSSAIVGFITYNENTQNKLIELGIVEAKIKIIKNYYF